MKCVQGHTDRGTGLLVSAGLVSVSNLPLIWDLESRGQGPHLHASDSAFQVAQGCCVLPPLVAAPIIALLTVQSSRRPSKTRAGQKRCRSSLAGPRVSAASAAQRLHRALGWCLARIHCLQQARSQTPGLALHTPSQLPNKGTCLRTDKARKTSRAWLLPVQPCCQLTTVSI